ncbi:DUF4294 domain-containing protein [Flavobacteriaceae bacterium]|jgi:hypothetical protein|nr:DUF4294 domain-containing protein [Flavobacteriaceae bacterium]MBT4232229.1 DUF4294 domain-containing protein [Flavobacteriaceae bacterium]MDA9827315.1 DUF4294 domain-containing protein [Flavobacteriaceae bacterium]
MKNLIFFLFFITGLNSYSQVVNKDIMIMIQGDSIASSSIDLEEIVIFPKLIFNNYKEKLRYYTIKKKTLKVYPYAVVASERLTKLNERLKLIDSRSAKKKYTRLVEKYIENELSAKLKKLTRTEGQILIKLIYRETGETVYDLVKKLRNRFRAFSYSSLAKLFDISIKIEYDPYKNDEDAIIEDVLKRAYGDKSIILDIKQVNN